MNGWAIVIAPLRERKPHFAQFVHHKLPLAARLGLCWGARPATVNFVGDEVTSLILISDWRLRIADF
jgi:hypothetical protein